MISVRTKMISAFAILLATLIFVLNTFPIFASRDSILRSKKSSLQSQAMVMSSSLSSLETLSVDGVQQVMELIDSTSLTRIIITDNTGLILFDSSSDDSAVGRYALFKEVRDSLQGLSVFNYSYENGAFITRFSVPIQPSGGSVLGSVYLYEYDAEQGEYLHTLQTDLKTISFTIGILGFLLIFVIATTFTRRIKKLSQAVHIVSNGNYAYRSKVNGSDEISDLTNEFNNLTGRLESTEEARRRFVSDASHELRTPLAAIRLLSDSITQSGKMDGETMREFASDIGTEAERLQRTTEKLMSLTKLDAGTTHTNRDYLNLAELIRRTFHLLMPLAAAKNVSITSELAEDCTVFASSDELYQVIFNLIENGIKYNVDGGNVHVTLVHRSASVFITVEDTGIGIPEEELPSIFDRFYRVDKARSRASGGSGLGLSIVKGAVEANGGVVDVSRRTPQGTCFSVTFPYAEKKECDSG